MLNQQLITRTSGAIETTIYTNTLLCLCLHISTRHMECFKKSVNFRYNHEFAMCAPREVETIILYILKDSDSDPDPPHELQDYSLKNGGRITPIMKHSMPSFVYASKQLVFMATVYYCISTQLNLKF